MTDAERERLVEAQKVAGNVLWLNNNMHNYGSDDWRAFFKATVRDARRFYDLADRLLAEHLEGGDVT